jgi:hypothetical protein
MQKLVSTDNLSHSISKSRQTVSPRLVNWVEPVDVSGYTKTLFYTEVSSNLKEGDIVFIINGNYDSNLLIESGKYTKGSDGYRVLSVDKCKVVLDIDFVGYKPWNDDSIDKFVKVQIIDGVSGFTYVNRLITSQNGYLDKKFNIYNNNVLFTSRSFPSITGTIGDNLGLTASPAGFFLKNDIGYWNDITSTFMSGTFSYSSGSTNERIKIVNSSFTYLGKEYKEGFIYKFKNGEWVIDVTYHQPIITKSNFRGGNFKGTWNSGLFGVQENKIDWEGGNWNNGTLLNTNWKDGSLNSNLVLKENYIAGLDPYGLPYQKISTTDNNGYGYSYAFDSEIRKGKINNGNFYNSLISPTSSTFSSVESYILSITQSYDMSIFGGNYIDNKIDSSYVYNSDIKNSRLSNTKIEKSKSTNSFYKNSLFYKSNFNSDGPIKVLSYDRWEVNSEHLATYSVVYKFYISEENYSRLRYKDQFYIKGVVSGNDLINFFDKKFMIDTYFYEEDVATNSPSFIGKKPMNYLVSISSINENKYILSGTSGNGLNPNKLPSVDIQIQSQNSTYLDMDPSKSGHQSDPWLDIDVSNAYIVDSDFRSGLFETSNWNSGSNINHSLSTQIPNVSTIGGIYSMFLNSIGTNRLKISMPPSTFGIDDHIFATGSIVYLNSIDHLSQVGFITNLPDTYKIVSSSNDSQSYFPGISTRILILEDILGTASPIIGLTSTSGFLTSDGVASIGNRFEYIHPVKINNSNVKSGIFRRSYITNSVIYNENYNNRDMDFSDIPSLKSLMITDTILRNAGNNINSGTFLYSFMAGSGTILGSADIWNNGIFYNSTWNGSKFINGTFRESRWEKGNFMNGVFYKSNPGGYLDHSYNSYHTERRKSYWRKGTMSALNDRWSWIDGDFLNGEFYKSGFEDGTFIDGKFYLSDFYSGKIDGGVFGDDSLSSSDTNIYSGTINDIVVENANVYSTNTDYATASTYLAPVDITWNNGIFKNGVFGNTIKNSFGNTESSTITWVNGKFEGGSFESEAIWKNGTFNGGKFISTYGWTMSDSSSQADYSWEDGIFNGGVFGNANGFTNSTWYTGEFNGGKFFGRVWNNGVLTSGEFDGSGTFSPISVLGTTCSNPSNFVDSFTNSYYGLWRAGIVTDTKDKFIKDRKLYTDLQRNYTEKKIVKQANLNNVLWVSGTFSHPSGEIRESVWLDGKFEAGKFKYSSFNPYVKRNGSTSSSFNLDDSCYWVNGTLDSSDFYISKWDDGRFLLGTATGMIWKNGVANYMNAYNVFWENGTWRNGNWNGSFFEINSDGSITDDYTRQIIFRGMSWSGTASLHVWDTFNNLPSVSSTLVNATASTVGNNLSAPVVIVLPD